MAFKINRSLRTLLSMLLLLVVVACSAPAPSPPSAQATQAPQAPPSPLMAMLFDIPPPGQQYSSELSPRLPRRTVPKPPEIRISKEYIAMVESLIKAGAPPNWPDIFKKLPKDDDNNIDWMAALESKAITPSGVINASDKDEGKTSDDDIELSTSGKPARMVIFSHKVHTQWLTCTNCHNAIFKREAGSATITMADIDDGKYCGVCHDKVAIAQPSGCKGCHKPIKKS